MLGRLTVYENGQNSVCSLINPEEIYFCDLLSEYVPLLPTAGLQVIDKGNCKVFGLDDTQYRLTRKFLEIMGENEVMI